MMRKLWLAFVALPVSFAFADGVNICDGAERNLAAFVAPGTWLIDYDLSKMLFPEIALPDEHHEPVLDQIRFVSNDSEEVREIFKAMPSCAYLTGTMEFPLWLPHDKLYFAISLENGNLILNIADNDQGYKSRPFSVGIGSSRESDKLLISERNGMLVMKRITTN